MMQLKIVRARIFLIVLFLILSIIDPSSGFSKQPEAISGRVVAVQDGDTVEVLTSEKKPVRIRLWGIDCPEKKQDFGQRAKQFTSDMVFGKEVDVEIRDVDRYGRQVGVVWPQGATSSLNEQLVAGGYAWVYRQYCRSCGDWLELEEQARATGKGLWSQGTPVPPWEWRKQRRR